MSGSWGVRPGLYQDFGSSIGFDAFIGGMFAAVRCFFLVVSFWVFGFEPLFSGLCFWVFDFPPLKNTEIISGNEKILI